MDMKIKDIAALFNVQENTVKQWIDEKKIPFYKVRNQYYFNKSEINEWILWNKLSVSDKILDLRLTAKPVLITELIKKGGLHYNINGNNIIDVIKNTIRIIPLPRDISKDEIESTLIERESMMTTAVGKGIAFPHPRNPVIADMDSEQISVCMLEKPVDFQAIDGIPVHTLFVIISSNSKRHLEILSKLSFLCQQESLVSLLEKKADKDSIISFINKNEKEWSER
ncbi:MAG: PTS sugar transporter subunit IIA [Spirochaetes bacterium]|nr:PTS sugar transporter subunit IIA [Spirochaetota bacterium]